MARKYSSEYKNLQPYVVEDARSVANAVMAGASGGGGGGITDHGALTGLSDDDHPQYLTPVRGDARYIASTRTLTAGAGLTGGGDLSADRTFTVGAGTLITVGADDVGITAGATYQFIGTASGTAAAWQNISVLAGNGLTAATGVLAVGVANTGAAGLTVEADAVRLTSSSSPGQAASILATDANGATTLYNGFYTQGAQSAATFASGFAGSGWRADYGVTTASKASIETDDLTVRGRMRVYELLIQQIRATNGSVFVSSASKVVTVSSSVNPLWTVNGSQLTFNGSNATLTTTLYTVTTAAGTDTDGGSNDRRLYHGFLYGDLIRAQQVRWNGSAFAGVIQSNLEVTGVTNLYTYQAALVSGDAAAVGYDYVRLGNSQDTTRQGSIYLTSDDSAAPFIDIVDGVNAHTTWNSASVARVRVGKLTGISDAEFGGALSGYGLYGNNVYLKGQIVVTGGSLGGLAAADVNSNTTTIDGGRITANSVTASQIAANTITATQIAASTITATELNVSTLSAISANMGSLTSGSVVIGSTNKLWLNDSADGALNIGGSTKASAPFRVTAAGALTATSATITGTITASSGGISGNFYVGSDVGASGNLYVGSNANMRFASDGARSVLEANSANTVPKSSSAYRWFSDISISAATAAASTTNYCGFVGNQHTGLNTVDLLLTSYVGNASAPNGYQTLNARTILQAGHYDGTYTDARLEVVREASTGAKYVATYGDRLEVENCIRLAEMSEPANPSSNQAYLFVKDNGSGKTQLCVRFASGASIAIATQA
jgi:hypothetical protein